MSKQELEAIIEQIQGKLLKYVITTALPLIVSGTVGVMVLKAAIEHNAEVSHSENVGLKHYSDSLHHDDQTQFNDVHREVNELKTQLNALPQSKTTIIKQTVSPKGVGLGLYTQRRIGNEIGWFKVN